MPKRALDLPGPVGPLEAVLSEPEGGAPTAIAVVCHPHPLHQGTMHNKVAVTLARCFEELDAAVVRFNFRGVGASAGIYAHGLGEREDAAAAAVWLRTRWPDAALFLAGFSFGGMIGASIATELDARGLVSVAPPLHRLGRAVPLPQCPWLLVQAGQDDVVDTNAVREWLQTRGAVPREVLLQDAGHFFHGRLKELGQIVVEFLREREEFAVLRQAHA